MELQFHLDESVNGAVAHGLWLRGIGVTTAKDAGLVHALVRLWRTRSREDMRGTVQFL